MTDFHGIIFAYKSTPELRTLVDQRTVASLPFCGRYRLIDFALSSMANAGIHNVGVILQRDYQSLLDHIGSGKSWDMSRKVGGLRILPPFGLPEYHTGNYTGTMEALLAVESYIHDIPQQHIVILLGNIVANIDLADAMEQHLHSDAPVTAICCDRVTSETRCRYITGSDGTVNALRFNSSDGDDGLASLEGYIIHKELLLKLMDSCKERNLYRFHKDALTMYLAEGGVMDIYVHSGYVSIITNVDNFYRANMDMLDFDKRRNLFPAERPVYTRHHEEVSTYYGENALAVNSLIADNCIIEGSVENSVIFSGTRIEKGAVVRNSIIMRGCSIGRSADLIHVISDKNCTFRDAVTLIGNEKLPVLVPKNSSI